MKVANSIKTAVKEQAEKGQIVAQAAAKNLKANAQSRVKSAKVQASRFKKTVDDALMDNEQLKIVRRKILQKKKLIEKEGELATQLALQILDRAKKMRLKLKRRAKKVEQGQAGQVNKANVDKVSLNQEG